MQQIRHGRAVAIDVSSQNVTTDGTPKRRAGREQPSPVHPLQQDEQNTVSAATRWWTGGIMVMVSVIVVMSFEALSLALPTMMVSMRVGLNDISWTLTGYMMSRTLFVGAAGWLGNRLGNRNLFAVSLAVFTGGSLLCGLAWNFESLILFRIFQGMGAGPLVPLIMVFLHDMFPPHQRGLAQSLYMVGDATGSILGRGLAGYLIEYLGWRMVFYSLVPLGVVSLAALLVMVPNRRETQVQTIDALGMLFLTGFVLCLFIGFQQGPRYGWERSSVQILLLLAAVSLVAFILTESLTSSPFMEVRLFRQPAYSLMCLVTCCNITGLMGAFFLIPLMLQRLLGFAPLQTGIMLIPGAIAWGVMGMIGGKLSDVFDARKIIMGGFALTGWVLLRFATITLETPASTLLVLATGLFCTSALVFTPINVISMRTIPDTSLRMGMGMMNLLRGLIAVMAIAILSLTIEVRQQHHFQILAQTQSQHGLEVAPTLHRLQALFRSRGDSHDAAAHKAEAVLNGRMWTEATVAAYQECFGGLAILYACAFVPLLALRRRYTQPVRSPAERT